jgi:ribosomal protein S17
MFLKAVQDNSELTKEGSESTKVRYHENNKCHQGERIKVREDRRTTESIMWREILQ